MKKYALNIFILILGLSIGAGGLWIYMGRRAPDENKTGGERKVLFYRHPMNPGITSPTPQKDEMGMDYVPVYEEEKAAPKGDRKVLFYRNPMNPEITSPVPMKDPMGMDYIPVYEEEGGQEAPGTVRISPEKIQKIGVKSEEVQVRSLNRVIRTVGRVEPEEDKVFLINAKVAGWIERLYVNRTDQMVSTNEKLLEIYSPELVSAQEEFLIAWRSYERMKDSPYPEVKKRAETLLEASRQRLKYWDISDDQIKRLEETGAITRTMTIRAPNNGSVTEKMVVEGQKIEAGEPLFKIIDHSRVWVYGEVYEYEIPYVKVGQTAQLMSAYSSGEVYKGKITHIYTHLGSIRYAPEEGTEIRTAKIRFELPNPEHRLKLGMYLNVELAVNVAKNALTVPDSAVIDSGTRQMLIVDRKDGTFEPREIRIGARGEDYYQVLEGVKRGEWVVTSANFLLDSESNLKAAIGGLSGHQHGGKQNETSEQKREEPDEKAQGHKGH